MVPLTPGVVVITVTLAGLTTTPAGMVSGVVVVVVVVTERVGVGGGGAETVCVSGPVAQLARRPRALQQAKTDVSCRPARTEVKRANKEMIFVFIPSTIRINSFPNYGVFHIGSNDTQHDS